MSEELPQFSEELLRQWATDTEHDACPDTCAWRHRRDLARVLLAERDRHERELSEMQDQS
jgi:hypothetical protein